MMDGGKNIFPQEGIAEALPILRTLQSATVFSHDDVQCVYEFEEIDKNLFPTLQSFEDALNRFSVNGRRVEFQPSEVVYPISKAVKEQINQQCNGADLSEMIGEIHMMIGYR